MELCSRLNQSPQFQINKLIRARPANPFAPVEISQGLLRYPNSRIFWSPQYMPPIASTRPVVVTLHDLLQLRYSSPAKAFYFKYVLKNLLKKASIIITVSEFSKAEIMAWSGRDATDIIVIPNGLSDDFKTEGPKFALNTPYFLYVGNHRAHKNLPKLLEAFAKFRSFTNCHLVLTGDKNTRLIELATALKIDNDITFIGFPGNSRLAELYRGAVATMYLSLYEGFGLPVIESMACGTPVLASNIGAISETAGAAALLVDPENSDAIVAGMDTLFHGGPEPDTIIERGLRRSRQFSWDTSYRKLAGVLKDLGNE